MQRLLRHTSSPLHPPLPLPTLPLQETVALASLDRAVDVALQVPHLRTRRQCMHEGERTGKTSETRWERGMEGGQSEEVGRED